MTPTSQWIRRLGQAALSVGARAAASLVIVVGLLGSPGRLVPAASAAPPASPTADAGNFVVTSAADTNNADTVLTLREALLVADGSLTSGLSAEEKLLLGGCIFSGSTITGGCGANITDTITFSGTLGFQPVISLTYGTGLPPLDDSKATIINGAANGVYPIIDAADEGTSNYGLVLNSQYNQISGLTIIHAHQDGLYVGSHYNHIGPNVSVRANVRHGIYINGGDYNVIEGSFFGMFSLSDASCTAGNGGDGIVLVSAANHNQIQSSAIGCNDNGVTIGGGSDNQIGAPLFGSPAQGNVISLNTFQGVYITGTTSAFNSLFNNKIGTDPTGELPRGNGQNGVYLAGTTHGNAVGSQATEANVISGNGAAGVLITGGANDNYVQGNYIGTDADGQTALANSQGVIVDNGAYNNVVGSDFDVAYLNVIAGNSGIGVLLSGSGTATNTVGYNDIGLNSGSIAAAGLLPGGARGLTTFSEGLPIPNGGPGLQLYSGAHHSLLVQNYVAYNGGSGVYFAGGSDDNTLWEGRVYSNTEYGVLFDNSAGNVISETAIYGNVYDGIGERNGATTNWWTQLSVYNNGGLGIDKSITSDGGNTLTPPTPVITSVQSVGPNLLIQGTAASGGLFNFVEVYEAAPDPSGSGEGRHYLGTATAISGVWSLSVPNPDGISCVTAFQINTFLAVPDFITTGSEFSKVAGACVIYLPLSLRN